MTLIKNKIEKYKTFKCHFDKWRTLQQKVENTGIDVNHPEAKTYKDASMNWMAIAKQDPSVINMMCDIEEFDHAFSWASIKNKNKCL